MPKLTASYKLNEDQIKQLKQIVPEAFKDNILDFNSLYEALSDFLEDDENTELEQFGLSWPGKRQAKRAAAIPPIGTLVPVPGDGVDEETTKNVYIEGDNLEVLKILKKAYTGRIKMIYIDPPYNTGNDFIYPDDFSESAESFQRRTGQLNENNEKMTTNNRSDGRFHSKWLSMMLPRLILARELLKEDGVIFISIDDNEVTQLRKICDEIFGEENFISEIIWKRKRGRDNSARWFSKAHEYLLLYAKQKDDFDINFLSLDEETKKAYKNPDNDSRGVWRMLACWARGTQGGVAYDFTNKDGQYFSRRLWLCSKDNLTKMDNENKLVIRGDNVYRKLFITENKGKIPETLWDNVSNAANAADEIKKIFNNIIFDTPKPIPYICEMLNIATDKEMNDIILDFFSGSSTTAHAVMQLNAEDGGNRQFIMVQYQEPCKEDTEAFKTGYKNICEIGKERIRRAGKKIKEEAGLNAANLDTGFKLFRLAPSNYKAWENYTGTDVKQLEQLFKADSLMPNWKEDDLLTEIMLLEGFPLDSKIELLPQFKKNKIKKISSDFRDNTLYICLDKDIVKETIEILKLNDKERFICLDSAIDDQSKIRLEDKNLIKTL